MKRDAGNKDRVKSRKTELYTRVSEILNSARNTIARSVNSSHVIANWMVGREIVVDEQKGRHTAAYGKRIIANLSDKLQKEFGNGYSTQNLFYMRQFYIEYPAFVNEEKIFHALRGKINEKVIIHALRGNSGEQEGVEKRKKGDENLWIPGKINPNLSWTHYRSLLKVKRIEVRSFYEIEAVKNGWGARELERQINSLLFERLLKSRNKKGVMELATKGQEVLNPVDIIKDPIILEFIDLPDVYLLNETDIETALINKLKNFLLELGSGFRLCWKTKKAVA